jgi:polyisoprenyl-teichoic acid--peptidoglycan teichoic acid transferase
LAATATTRKPAPRRKHRKRTGSGFRRLALALLILLPLAPLLGWSALRSSLQIPADPGGAPVAAGRPVYVAVMGVDEREHDVGRSDTLILLRLDSAAGTIQAVNIPRDTRVTFPSGRRSKINAAYPAGGPDFVTEVISHSFGVPRPYYVKVNFRAFEQLVDLLGGVEVNVEKHYQYDDPYQDLHIDLPAGRQVLNGKTALHYVRLRYDGVTNSDIARIERQQQFLQALKARLSSPAAWWHLRSMPATLRSNLQTNIPEADQPGLALALFKARNSLQMQTLPGSPDDSTGDWMLNPQKWNEVTRAWKAK